MLRNSTVIILKDLSLLKLLNHKHYLFLFRTDIIFLKFREEEIKKSWNLGNYIGDYLVTWVLSP